jgi:antitoxin (DNA-binding transcriptional repressor) of toxin-antitoxin stability system
MASMSVSSARADMHALLDAVERGDEVTLTRYGIAVAVVIRPDLLRARRASEAFAAASDVAALLESGRSRPLPSKKGLSVERADEHAAEVVAGRAGR